MQRKKRLSGLRTNLSIIGGGPAALMLAAQLNTDKYRVTLYEKKKSVGRKFLVAGEGGLNLTFNSSEADLIAQYYPGGFMDAAIRQFTNQDLMHWLNQLEVPTFTGSSNRVFPDPDLKPIQVLKKIVDYVSTKVEIQTNTKWLDWNEQGQLRLEGIENYESDIIVFALGGASWKVTGSDGAWKSAFENRGINVLPFRAANCAFEVDWNQQFIATHAGKPLKNIALRFNDHYAKGELVISKFGLEGNAIYALSQKMQEQLLTQTTIILHLDLKPTMTVDQLKTKYHNSRLSKVTDILSKDLNLDRASIGILKQFSDRATYSNPDLLAETIKAVPIIIKSPDRLDKAISSLGGIDLNEVDENYQLRKIPGSYAIGEMLDWYAPTGGYLLQGCFSMGFALAEYLNGLKVD